MRNARGRRWAIAAIAWTMAVLCGTTGCANSTRKASAVIERDQGRMIAGDMSDTYYTTEEEGVLHLYAIGNDGRNKRLLYVHNDRYEGAGDEVQRATFTDDWLLLSIGGFEGTARNYDGALYRIAKDGSTWGIVSDEANWAFWVIGDWVYTNRAESVNPIGMGPGRDGASFRVRIEDGKVENTAQLPVILECANRNIIYARYGENGHDELMVGDADGGTPISLFDPTELISAYRTDPDFTGLSYGYVQSDGDSVRFDVVIYGYNDTDTWRGHIMYERTYVVRLDGTGLEEVEQTE